MTVFYQNTMEFDEHILKIESCDYIDVVEGNGDIVVVDDDTLDIKIEYDDIDEVANKTTQKDIVEDLHKTVKQRKNQKGEFRCTVCGKVFTFHCNLLKHKKIHSGERNFICKVCDKSFTRSDHLKEHMKIHLGIRNHVCMICEKAFVRSEQLRVHLKNTHLNLRNFNCEVCLKKFKTKYDLQNHNAAIHTGMRKYFCHDCGKGFVTKSLLRTHCKSHMNLRSYVCRECGKGFNVISNKKLHMKSHYRRSRDCSLCGLEIGSFDNYFNHICDKIKEEPPETP